MWSRVTDRPGEPEHVVTVPTEELDVGQPDSDVLGAPVGASEPLDVKGEGDQQLRPLVDVGIADDDRLAATQRQAGQGVLVAHRP